MKIKNKLNDIYFLFFKFWNDTISSKKNSDGQCQLLVQDDFVRLSIDVLGECVLGYNFDSIRGGNNEIAQAFADLFSSADLDVGNMFFRQLLRYLPFTKEARHLKAAYQTAFKTIKKVISITSW